ncbi:MAG: tRNA pseudouridine(38-40) synthase TruA [Rickettsiales bacterium]
MRYKVTIEYDGTDFSGWQIQNNSPSIQEAIQKAIKAFSMQDVEVFGAGRTDAGVHALGQVAHFDLLDDKYSEHIIKNAINYHLKPKKIVILDCSKVSQAFHARFSAKKRYYEYKILNRDSAPAIDINKVWHISNKLDARKIAQAANCLVGKHDFTSFRASQCQSSSPIKTIDQILIEQMGEVIKIKVSAQSFLHHMVRNIVGTIYNAGLGKIKPDDMLEILDSKDRKKAGITAPACGLYFTKVEY